MPRIHVHIHDGKLAAPGKTRTREYCAATPTFNPDLTLRTITPAEMAEMRARLRGPTPIRSASSRRRSSWSRPERRRRLMCASALGPADQHSLSVRAAPDSGLQMKEASERCQYRARTAETHRHNFGRKLGNPKPLLDLHLHIGHSLLNSKLPTTVFSY